MSIKNKNKIERIKTAILKKPYIFIFVGVFLVYILINILVNQIYKTFPVLIGIAKWFLIPFLFFNFFLIPFLVSLTINLSILRFKEAGSSFEKKGTGVIGLGVFGGFLGGACAGCFVGLFPAVTGIFGVTASLSVLPLYGLELPAISAAFLIFAIHLLTKDIVCKVPLNPKK